MDLSSFGSRAQNSDPPHTHLSLRWVWYVVQADLQLRIFLPQLSECEVVREDLCAVSVVGS